MFKFNSIVLMFSFSCSMWQINPDHKYRVVFADGVDDNIKTAAIDASDSWATATADYVVFTTDNDPNLATITIHGKTSAELSDKADTTVYLDSENSDIYLPTDVDVNLQHQLALHEFGHALGLKHYVAGTVMYPNTSGGTTFITCADVDQFCFLWGCDPRTCPPCQTINH